MKRTKPVIPPSSYQNYTLRLMIFLGMICMFFFLAEMLSLGTDDVWLYWMLMLSLGFACLKILHEWLHYLFITVPQTPPGSTAFSVDIFTTFCKGEPYEMITETLRAIQEITYPHETYLCDEANDPYLREFCHQNGIHHVTRTLKINAKAGNINNALQESKGDLCLILDPDHVPFPDFLDPIVSHFNDPEIGFIQVVQSYKNQGEGLIAKGAAQQTYQFYGPMMMTMNHYGTVLAIGANCTFRRAALDSIGGHAAGLAEDMHTAMQLHAKGWKSRYVPAVVARGLVPSSLSAYYAQQLKWSRGVFELLVTTYPKLFRQFSWQQKLHYGTIPLFYLSGLFFLINFLIPIFSLVLNTSPARIDFDNFLTLGLPLLTAIMLIRHYVQSWVMEEEERGFHVVGGLLMIGTWWIYLLGFYYTLLRRVVPYNPTPKDGNEQNNWPLNRPNLVIIGLSLLAIGYGLRQDYNPYNLFMAGFAFLNCLILSFTVAASRQLHFRRFKINKPRLSRLIVLVADFKTRFWKLRRRIYGLVRGTAFMLSVMVACFSIYIVRSQKQMPPMHKVIPSRNDLLIAGIYAPAGKKAQTSLALTRQIEQNNGLKFGLISLYLAWGDDAETVFPRDLLDSIYQQDAIPMITWEPWQSRFAQNQKLPLSVQEKKVFARILRGDYDAYLDDFSSRIGAMGRPVFIRFAHEADNPQYPWSERGGNSPEEFKAAWRYVHAYFERKKLSNVIWVWNPWRANAVSTYFPGKDYVDWIGLTSLNYAEQNADRKWYSMEELYHPFRRLPVFQSGIPVMLAEMGSVQSGGRQEAWFQEAFTQIRNKYQEIKAVVFFHSDQDTNSPNPALSKILNWKLKDFRAISREMQTGWTYTDWFSNEKTGLAFAPSLVSSGSTMEQAKLNELKGVNYDKDQNWEISYQNLKIAEIRKDFREMKGMGINTIKHDGPNIYDHNILQIAAEQGIKIVYSFWLPEEIDYLKPEDHLQRLSTHILNTVKSLRDHAQISMWNIGPSPFTQLKRQYAKPDLLYAEQAYLIWLNELCRKIKLLDPQRKLSVDLNLSSSTAEEAGLLVQSVPEIDYLGLSNQSGEEKSISSPIPDLPRPYFFSRLNTAAYLSLSGSQTGVIIQNWQDRQTKRYVTFDGLRDLDGRHKAVFFQLQNKWSARATAFTIPEFQILKPASTLFENNTATYHIIDQQHGHWQLRDKEDGLNFSWQLVKKNKYHQEIERKELGTGLSITFKIPAHSENYDIYVHVSQGNQVRLVKTSLNTPLY